jgi:hypothetical protein
LLALVWTAAVGVYWWLYRDDARRVDRAMAQALERDALL